MSDTTRWIFTYEAVISFLEGALKSKTKSGVGRSPTEVAKAKAMLDSYLHSAASTNVDAVVRSLECRKTLLEISSSLGLASDSNLRASLHADDKRVATLLLSIFNSTDDALTVLDLEGDPAQCFLDVVQDTLDRGFLMEPEHSRMARRIIRKLSESCDKFPSSLFITGVTGREEDPTFGGGYGDIYRASCNNVPVALKRLRYFIRGSELRRIRAKFCREALLWRDLNHPHILPFLGIDSSTFSSTLCMVSPWMEHGTVMRYLKEHGHADVDKLLCEIAQGLQYLHSRHVVHGDLRGNNILITQDWRACLADFGLSVVSNATSSMSTNRGGSVYWMAPELLDSDRFGFDFARTPASDVYAYGCVCLELYTGKPPFAGLREPAALLRVLGGERPDRPLTPPLMSDTLWQHITTYWVETPAARPETQLVVQNMVWPTLTQADSPSAESNEISKEYAPGSRGSMAKLFGVGIYKPKEEAPQPPATQQTPPTTPIHQQFATRPADDERWEVVDQLPPGVPPVPSPTRAPYTTSIKSAAPQQQTLRKTRPVRGILHSLEPMQPQEHVRNKSEERVPVEREKGKEKKGGFWGWGQHKDRDREREREREREWEREREQRAEMEREQRAEMEHQMRAEMEREQRAEMEHQMRERERGRERGDDDELTRKIGFLTATASEDWALVLDVCDHASATEANAKEAVRALRREFKYGEPAGQLAAARLWAIMLRNSTGTFITQSTAKKFLDTLENLLTSPNTIPVVRERAMDVLAAAAYTSGSSEKKDAGFRGLWRRVRPRDKPEEGMPFDTEDAMFNPPALVGGRAPSLYDVNGITSVGYDLNGNTPVGYDANGNIVVAPTLPPPQMQTQRRPLPPIPAPPHGPRLPGA